MHSLAALAPLLLRMEQVKTTPLGISLPAGRAPSCPPFAPRHGGAHAPGHQLFQASLPLLTLTTLSGVPFPFSPLTPFSSPRLVVTSSVKSSQVAPSTSGQISLPSFLGTHSPQACLSFQSGNLLPHVVIYPFPCCCKHLGRRNQDCFLCLSWAHMGPGISLVYSRCSISTS